MQEFARSLCTVGLGRGHLVQVVTVSCTASGMMSISPTTFTISATTFDAMSRGALPRPSVTISVTPYFGNDVGAVRTYSIACSAAAALAGGTSFGGPQPVYAAPRVHSITGTVTPSVFPVWEGQCGHGSHSWWGV